MSNMHLTDRTEIRLKLLKLIAHMLIKIYESMSNKIAQKPNFTM